MDVFQQFFCAALEVKFNLHTALGMQLNFSHNYN